MTREYPYNERFDPPAPIVAISLAAPLSDESVVVEALVDSGADVTVVPVDVINRLRLRRVDMLLVAGVEGEAKERPAFAVTLAVEEVLTESVQRVIGWDGDYALLGRDVLNQLTALLDGPGGRLEMKGP